MTAPFPAVTGTGLRVQHLVLALGLAVLLPGSVRGADDDSDHPGLAIKDVHVQMERVEKVKRRLQGSKIVRENVLVGWNWNVEVALDRSTAAESGEWQLTGKTFEKLLELSEGVRGWTWGKKSKNRLRVQMVGFLPAAKGGFLSSVAMMAARELKKDLRILPLPPEKPEERPLPAEPRPEPRSEPRPAPESEPRSTPHDPRLSSKESIATLETWEQERQEFGLKVIELRNVMEDAEGHEDQVEKARVLVDAAAQSLADAEPFYLACVALVDAGERILLSLRLKVNVRHFKAHRDLQSAEKHLIVFTGPGSNDDPGQEEPDGEK